MSILSLITIKLLTNKLQQMLINLIQAKLIFQYIAAKNLCGGDFPILAH